MRANRKFPHRADICIFGRRCEETGAIVAIVLFRLGDLIMAGASREIAKFEILRDGFLHGGILVLGKDIPLGYCGLRSARHNRSIGIAQDNYRGNIAHLRMADFFRSDSTPIGPGSKKTYDVSPDVSYGRRRNW